MKQLMPLFIHFESKDLKPEETQKQAVALVKAHSHLILGFSEGVKIPDFSEFPPPKIYKDDLHGRINEYREILKQRGQDPDKVRLLDGDPTVASVMYFFRQQLLQWFCYASSAELYEEFNQMNRESRRGLEKIYKFPVLPIGIKVTYSPKLIRSYNIEAQRLMGITNSKR